MFKKVTNNCKDLLLQILLMLILGTALIFYGILTRPSTFNPYTNSSTHIAKSSYSSAQDSAMLQGMAVTLQNLTAATEALTEELRLQREQSVTLLEEDPNDPIAKARIYDEYVYEIVSEYYPSLNPQLIRAIIYHESRYDESKVNSRTKASGLMQLSPKWQMGRAKSLGVTDLFDPYGNILTGCDFLNDLFSKYSYNYALDLYAGGYPYARQNKGQTSKFIKELDSIMLGLANGSIIPGGN